jgi:hypothetical protein
MDVSARKLDLVIRVALGAMLPALFSLFGIILTQRSPRIGDTFFLTVALIGIPVVAVCYGMLRRRAGLRVTRYRWPARRKAGKNETSEPRA